MNTYHWALIQGEWEWIVVERWPDGIYLVPGSPHDFSESDFEKIILAPITL